MSETLDYFDRYGFFKGRETREVIHNNGAWHRGVHVWVFSTGGKIFLKKRAEGKDTFPGHWEDVGEHLKPGEGYEAGAKRGLEEELGIKSVVLEKMASDKMTFPENNSELIELWKCVYNGRIRENRGESTGGKFFSVGEIREMIKERGQITPWFKELFYWYLKEGKE